jgi:protein-tyrosine phosphatase
MSTGARRPDPVIDLHSHILPGIDDGARTIEDALGIARAAVADGICVLAATPHVRDHYPTSAETMEERLAELQLALREEDVALELRGGGEIALDWLAEVHPDELPRFGLGGNPEYVLLEFPYAGWPLALGAQVLELGRRGITAVIAHPERSASVQSEPKRLHPIVDAGALVQVTAASIDGRLGKDCRRTGLTLIENGLAHMIASDAHLPDVRRIGLSAAREEVADDALGRWLTEDVPGAIVSGVAVPPRPMTSRARRRALGIFRR